MKKTIVAAALLAGALAAGPAAWAGDVDVGISIGIPGVVWGGPTYYYPPPPPPRYYRRPPVVVVPEPVYVPAPVYRPGWVVRGHYDRYEPRYGRRFRDHDRGYRGHGRGRGD